MKKIYLLWLIFIFVFISNSFTKTVAQITNIDEAIKISESTNMPVLLVFGADWCGFCKRLKEDMDTGSLKTETENFIVCYIDIDTNKKLKREFGVRTVPDSRVILKRKEISKYIGYDNEKYKKWINNVAK